MSLREFRVRSSVNAARISLRTCLSVASQPPSRTSSRLIANQLNCVSLLSVAAILYNLKSGKTSNLNPTVGFNVEIVKYKNVKFSVWVSAPDRKWCNSQSYRPPESPLNPCESVRIAEIAPQSLTRFFSPTNRTGRRRTR